MGYQPVIIIGAPRSGTNLLRDLLTAYPGLATWPCDEINPIWRYGNINYPHDCFPPELATSKVSAYIQNQFHKLAKKRQADYVVEKTCANALRVPFIHHIFPEAKFIYIVRDGVDASASAMKRWQAGVDLGYTLRKARYVPLRDLPRYGARFAVNRAHRLMSREKSVKQWGPCLPDMADLCRQYSLPEVCAFQWRECIRRSDRAFQAMPDEQCVTIYYEQLLRSPEATINAVFDFLDYRRPQQAARQPAIDPAMIGKGRKSLTHEDYQTIQHITNKELELHGYAG